MFIIRRNHLHNRQNPFYVSDEEGFCTNLNLAKLFDTDTEALDYIIRNNDAVREPHTGVRFRAGEGLRVVRVTTKNVISLLTD